MKLKHEAFSIRRTKIKIKLVNNQDEFNLLVFVFDLPDVSIKKHSGLFYKNKFKQNWQWHPPHTHTPEKNAI